MPKSKVSQGVGGGGGGVGAGRNHAVNKRTLDAIKEKKENMLKIQIL